MRLDASTASNAPAGMRLSSDELVAPARVRAPLVEPVRAVVREDQAVALHRHEHDLRLRAEAREREVRLEAEARAHRRKRRIARRAGLVPRGPDVGAVGPLRGEADRVVDEAARDLVVAEDARPDG